MPTRYTLTLTNPPYYDTSLFTSEIYPLTYNLVNVPGTERWVSEELVFDLTAPNYFEIPIRGLDDDGAFASIASDTSGFETRYLPAPAPELGIHQASIQLESQFFPGEGVKCRFVLSLFGQREAGGGPGWTPVAFTDWVLSLNCLGSHEFTIFTGSRWPVNAEAEIVP